MAQQALSGWSLLRENFSIDSASIKPLSSEKGKRYALSGMVLKEPVSFELQLEERRGKTRIRHIKILYGPLARLSTEQFRAIFKEEVDRILPPGMATQIGIKYFEVVLDEREEIDTVNIILSFGQWAPFNEGSVRMAEIIGEFGLSNLRASRPDLVVGLKSDFVIPADLARAFSIGETRLQIAGYVNTRTGQLLMAADLASKEIPLVTDRSLVMKQARLQFYIENAKPGFGLAGKIEIRPPGQAPIDLNGEVAIDLTGKVSAAAWMDQEDYIQNPFGLSEKVFIEQAGLGFGVDFKTTPIPAPSIALEGGIAIRNARQGPALFGGYATLGVDLTEPNKSLIDAELEQVRLADFIDAFQGDELPSEFVQTLRKIEFQKLHMTLVPPGVSVTLFGREYEPGLYAEGQFSYGDFTGVMLIDLNQESVEAFGGMTPLSAPGFSLTGTTPGGGPYMMLALNPAERVAALGVNGDLQILGGTRHKTDIYLSDAGFSATVKTRIFNQFSSTIDIAGGELTRLGTIYAKAQMSAQSELATLIGRLASEEIGRAAQETQGDFDRAKADLERLRPQLNGKKRQLEQRQATVRSAYEKSCRLLDQKRNQERERSQLTARVNSLKSEVDRMERELSQQRYKRATPKHSTTCGGNSKNLVGDDRCYSCPAGFQWNGPVSLNNAQACVKRGQREWRNPQDRGAVRGIQFPPVTPCPSGSAINTAHNRCYACPADFAQELGFETKRNPRCFRDNREQFSRPTPGRSVRCSGINDLGQCWSCPSGYSRKVTIYPINGAKACELNTMAAREAAIRDKRLTLAAEESRLVTLTHGLGELAGQLSGVASNVCSQASSSAAINADPRVAGVFAEWSALSLTVNELQAIVDTAGQVSVGSLQAAAWIARHGGEALGVVDIRKAAFEGCLSTLDNGRVALSIEGTFADQPIRGAFDVNLRSPAAGIEALARQLLNTKRPSARFDNGNCRRPNVPRPQVAGPLADKLALINRGLKTQLKPRLKAAAPPEWASSPPRNPPGIDPTRFDIKDREARITLLNADPSVTRPIPPPIGAPSAGSGVAVGGGGFSGDGSFSGSTPSALSWPQGLPRYGEPPASYRIQVGATENYWLVDFTVKGISTHRRDSLDEEAFADTRFTLHPQYDGSYRLSYTLARSDGDVVTHFYGENPQTGLISTLDGQKDDPFSRFFIERTGDGHYRFWVKGDSDSKRRYLRSYLGAKYPSPLITTRTAGEGSSGRYNRFRLTPVEDAGATEAAALPRYGESAREYRIRVKASGRYWHEDGTGDRLVSSRYQPDDDFNRFLLHPQSDGSYRISVKADNRRDPTPRFIRVHNERFALVSTRESIDDDYSRFYFEPQTDGSYRIRLKGLLKSDFSSDGDLQAENYLILVEQWKESPGSLDKLLLTSHIFRHSSSGRFILEPTGDSEEGGSGAVAPLTLLLLFVLFGVRVILRGHH